MGVADWLKPVPRVDSGFSFQVTDLVEETSEAPSSTDLANLMRDSYWGTDRLANVANRYGWSAVREKFIQARGGTSVAVSRGDFGEAVTVQYLKEGEDYIVPVMKLRYKVAANQTLPGTDCLALKISENVLAEVAFVESKFRSSRSPSVAVEGAKQLKEDSDSALPDILVFVARMLSERGDPLAQLMEDYIFQRNLDLDQYILMLLCDQGIWREIILENLEDEGLELEPLHVYVGRVANLSQLSDSAFSVIGAGVIEDDD